MASAPADSVDPLRERVARALPGPLATRPVLSILGAIVLVSLVARLVALGARATHWDEARVAYWTLYAHEQGSFTYRYIIHGPFVQHTARWLFSIFGVSDVTIRLPVAIVGSLLPLSAWLFRNRLKPEETVALGLLLAFNPVLLYYSRFMRSDVLVAAFMFTALGMVVRYLDTRLPAYLYGVGVFATLAVASKENAILYPVTWLGALALVAERHLDSPGSETTGIERAYLRLSGLWDRFLVSPMAALGLGAVVGGVLALVSGSYVAGAVVGVVVALWAVTLFLSPRVAAHLLGVTLVSGLLFLFLFAPRGGGFEGMKQSPATVTASTVNLGNALTNPTMLPDLVIATGEQFIDQYGAWGGKSSDLTFGSYLTRVGGSLKALAYAAFPLSVLSLVGFARERYGVAAGRPFVMALFFAGIASLVGYPLGLSIDSGYKWNIIHVLVPLAVPAAVGAGMVGRWVYNAFRTEDVVGRGLLGFVVVIVVGLIGFQALTVVYLNPNTADNEIVQHGQPADELQPLVDNLTAAAEAGGSNGTEVLIYADSTADGSFVRSSGNKPVLNFIPHCTDWPQTLPLNWYLFDAGTANSCVRSVQGLRYEVTENSPPVVIVKAGDSSVPAPLFEEEYVSTTYSLRAGDDRSPRATVYVRSDIAAAS